MKAFINGFGLLITCIFLSACDTGNTYAPVVEISTIEHLPQGNIHRANYGETLYEIAWRYGLDYQLLADINHINFPYKISEGQIIRLKAIEPIATHVNVDSPPPSPGKWVWPAKGKIVKFFSATNKGVNIAGPLKSPIYAALTGKVVYAGDGLRGYGNLIIIKHNNVYLSAYAHNRVILVKEGQMVKGGQRIAEMGHTGTTKTMLHFEIRRAGKPINPMLLYQ